MPNYTRTGKIEQPITPEDWHNYMEKGRFIREKHKGFCAVLYYFAVRSGEALKTVKEQFDYDDEALYWDVGLRLKHSKRTPTLNILKDLPYVDRVISSVEDTGEGEKVFPYSRKTGYNIVSRVFPSYPHFFRLSRITQMFNDGWTLTEVRSWTGLTLNALNYYIGLASIREKGKTIR